MTENNEAGGHRGLIIGLVALLLAGAIGVAAVVRSRSNA